MFKGEAVRWWAFPTELLRSRHSVTQVTPNYCSYVLILHLYPSLHHCVPDKTAVFPGQYCIFCVLLFYRIFKILYILFVMFDVLRAQCFMLRNVLSFFYCKEGTMWVWYRSVCLSPCGFFPRFFFFPNLLACVRLLSFWRCFCVIFLYVLWHLLWNDISIFNLT